PQNPKNKNLVISICIKIRKNPCYAWVFKGFSALFFTSFKIHPQKRRKNYNTSLNFSLTLFQFPLASK
ncbi:hypothetical protein VYI21_011315, partial [Streptococcus anginosus]